MATDAIVLEQSGTLLLPPHSLTTVAQLGPLQPGRSYVIWAKGSVSTSNAAANFELDAFGAKDEAEVTSGAHGQSSFSLAVATTLTADDSLYVVAKLSGGYRALSGFDHSGIAAVKNVKLIALAVDSVEVRTA